MQIPERIVEVNEEEDGLEQKFCSSSFMSEIFEITLRTLERYAARQNVGRPQRGDSISNTIFIILIFTYHRFIQGLIMTNYIIK